MNKDVPGVNQVAKRMAGRGSEFRAHLLAALLPQGDGRTPAPPATRLKVGVKETLGRSASRKPPPAL